MRIRAWNSICLRLLRVIQLASILFAVFCCHLVLANALEPKEILVLANRNARHSIGLAKYYMEKRKIPEANLIKLWVTDKQGCKRAAYEKKIAVPVRRYISNEDPLRSIRCLVIMYGLPLRIHPPKMSTKEKDEYDELIEKRTLLNQRLKDAKAKENKEKEKQLKKELKTLKKRLSKLSKRDQLSSLDSEIALVLEEEYSRSRWVPNPFYVGYRGRRIPNMPVTALMVSRLDGPSPEIVKRIIDDAIKTEETGLAGTAYFDARYAEPKDNKTSGSGLYDQSIHRAARLLKETATMPVVLDDESALFQPGACPNAALYCGWYSHHQYIDSFTWQSGSVGYHIASSECGTLKGKKSQVWCKRMLDEGITATLGPIGEPYVQAFPLPEVFFGLLIQGDHTLAECYALSNPFLSWRMVLIGDPLYRPFGEGP